MDRSNFLRALASESRELQEMLTSRSRQWFVDLVERGIDRDLSDDSSPSTVPTDRIYELMCYFFLVKELCKVADKWQLIVGQGHHGYRMPYSPGQKESFAFFRFKCHSELFDLCCGVKIPVDGEPSEAPDISLQQVTEWDSKDRSTGKIVGMWEGKYHSRKNKLSKADFNQMVARCDVIRLPACCARDILERFLPDPFTISAIVSNTPRAEFNKEQRFRHRFSIIFSFRGQNGCTAEPSREEHIKHNTGQERKTGV